MGVEGLKLLAQVLWPLIRSPGRRALHGWCHLCEGGWGVKEAEGDSGIGKNLCARIPNLLDGLLAS